MNQNAALPSFTFRCGGKDVTFTSAFPRLDQCYRAVDGRKRKSAFTRDLLQRARERKLSEGDVAWLHYLATEMVTMGQQTGRCQFCGRELSTKESLAVGYGPTCADERGLPWGVIATEETKPAQQQVQQFDARAEWRRLNPFRRSIGEVHRG